MGALAHEASDHASQRPVDDLHEHAFADERTGIVCEVAFDQLPDAGNLMVGDGRRLALERDDVHDTRALQHGQPVHRVEPRETVAGEQRPVDLLLAVLPAAPPCDSGQEGLDTLLLELFPDDLLMPRAGPQREPADVGVARDRNANAEIGLLDAQRVARFPRLNGSHCAGVSKSFDFRSASACSYAFFNSSFFHWMMACARSFSTYFCNSPRRFSSATFSLISFRASSNDFTFSSVRDSSLRIWYPRDVLITSVLSPTFLTTA